MTQRWSEFGFACVHQGVFRLLKLTRLVRGSRLAQRHMAFALRPVQQLLLCACFPKLAIQSCANCFMGITASFLQAGGSDLTSVPTPGAPALCLRPLATTAPLARHEISGFGCSREGWAVSVARVPLVVSMFRSSSCLEISHANVSSSVTEVGKYILY